MTDLIELQNRNLSCAIAPDCGAAVMRLDIVRKGVVHHVLRPTAPELISPETDPRLFALTHMIPLCGPVRGNQFKWDGKPKELAPNLPDTPLFTNGIGWQSKWAGKKDGKYSATCRMHHKANAVWPFEFAANIIFDLEEDNLAITYEITNEGKMGLMPVGFGADIALPRHPKTMLSAGVSSIWHVDEQGVPTTLGEVPFNLDIKEGIVLDSFKTERPLWYQGWSQKASIDYALTRLSTMIKTDSILEHLGCHVPKDKDFFHLSVMSHAAGVLSMQNGDEGETGFRVLGPGEGITGRLKIDVDLNLY